MDYKLSNYNYFLQYDSETILCINLIKKQMFALDIDKYNFLQNNSTNLNNIKHTNIHLFNALLKLGIIIDSKNNELYYLITEHRKAIYNEKFCRITILPTLDCNFNCWYCYEKHPKGYLNAEIQKSIIKHVIWQIKENKISQLQLDWFGSEPLMYFYEVVFPLSKTIKNLCVKNKVFFSNVITTNGFLMEEKIISDFKKISLNHFQITLDGSENQHNKVKKNINNELSYRKIIENIIALVKSNDLANVSIRINYTKDNLHSIEEIINDIPQNIRQRIEVFFQQVWQTQKVGCEINVKEYKEIFKNEGFISPLYKIQNNFYKCYADTINQFVISTDGKVFKCTARDFATTENDGELLKNGKISWNQTFFKKMSKTTIKNTNCLNCNFLPACWGPCSQKNIEYSQNDFEKICNKKGIETTYNELLVNFYETKVLKRPVAEKVVE